MGMQDRLVVILLLVLAAVVAMFLLVALLTWALPGAAPLGDWANIVLALVTILAVLFGGLFAAVKFDLFRDFEPHLNISHVVNHRSIGDSYVHLGVTVIMRNSSKVKVELQRGFLLLQSISPITDQNIERIYEEAFAEGDFEDFGWPVLEEQVQEWQRNELFIEPGEEHSELLEFIISREIKTILVYTFYYYPDPSGEARGWSKSTVYDIMD